MKINLKYFVVVAFALTGLNAFGAEMNAFQGLRLDKLENCRYIDGANPSLVGNLLVKDENKKWIHSKSLTRLIGSMDSVTTTPYPFKLLSDVYVTPEGYQAFVAEDPVNFPGLVQIMFVAFEEMGFHENTFDLMTNIGDVKIAADKVFVGKDGVECSVGRK